MKTGWKYCITMAEEQTIRMPKGARILSVQVQDGTDTACLWAMVETPKGHADNTGAGYENRKIRVRGTDHDCSGIEAEWFLGTVQRKSFVFHVFVVPARPRRPPSTLVSTKGS